MRYLSVAETAKKWNISERSMRNYCANGRVNGAFLTGKTWNVLEDAEKPTRPPRKLDCRKLYWKFYRTKKQVNILGAFTTRHRLI